MAPEHTICVRQRGAILAAQQTSGRGCPGANMYVNPGNTVSGAPLSPSGAMQLMQP